MYLDARLSVYLFKIGQKLHRKEYVPALMKCPECRRGFDNWDDANDDTHIVIRQKIKDTEFYYCVVGCEGYWTVDPKKLGLPRGNWEPVWSVIKKNLEYYIREPKTYAPEPFDEVTEENKPEIAKVINRDGRLSAGEKANLLKQLDD